MKEYKYKINGTAYSVVVGEVEGKEVQVEVNGTKYTVELEKEIKPKIKPIVHGVTSGPVAAPQMKRAVAGSGGIKSPLPGVILDIKVNVGDAVKRGDTLLILEAMKMENDIKADRDGKVAAIKVSKGESILEGTDLIIIE